MAWDQGALIRLREILVRLYPTERDARRVIEDAGLNPAMITFDGKAINTWANALREANHQPGKVEAIIGVALDEYPGEEGLQRAAQGAPPPILSGPEPVDWRGPKGPGQLEKIIGRQSTLVPISYLEIGLLRSRSVARVRLSDGSAGSGFLVDDGLLVTNNHVLPDPETARAARAMFNYQQTATGLSAEVDERELLPDEMFRTSKADDWSIVRVAGDPNAAWGALELGPANVAVGDRVNIIQHPNGLPKQISWYSNVVVFTGAGRIQYLTDTDRGSSGSPVFDHEWNVVALHHSGGWLPEPGSSDPNREFYRNEGIAIDLVIAGLRA